MTDRILLFSFYLLFPTLIIGPLGKFSLGKGLNVYPNDFLILIISVILFSRIKWMTKEFKMRKIYPLFYSFAIFALISLLISPVSIGLPEKFLSSLYLVRFVLYFNIFIAVRYLIEKKIIIAETVGKLLVFTGISLCIVGWLQYFLYPNLRNIMYLGWDPHDKRILGTYFDPNFFGLMLVLSIINVYFSFSKTVGYPVLFFNLISLMFTYSRGSFLSLFLSASYYFVITRKVKIMAGFAMIFLLAVFVLPKPVDNAGVDLGRIFSINERLNSWKLALKLSADNPVLGIGFNTLRYVKPELGVQESAYDNHSASGIDNSLLFVLVTTGSIGLAVFCAFLKILFDHLSLFGKISLSAVLIHSLFTNSLFFPFAMIWLWMVSAKEFSQD